MIHLIAHARFRTRPACPATSGRAGCAPERAEGDAKKREERADQQKCFVHAEIVAGEARGKNDKKLPGFLSGICDNG